MMEDWKYGAIEITVTYDCDHDASGTPGKECDVRIQHTSFFA